MITAKTITVAADAVLLKKLISAILVTGDGTNASTVTFTEGASGPTLLVMKVAATESNLLPLDDPLAVSSLSVVISAGAPFITLYAE